VPTETEVWVINTQSRGDSPSKAAKKVRKAAEYLKEWNADYFYKKVDSTLRGNIGAELDAMIEVLNIEELPFCAAFPSMGRTTVGNVHYVDGEEVDRSSYSKDIAAPVKESNINKLLESQMKNFDKVSVKNASSDRDLKLLSEKSPGRFFAGAAALAGMLADRWLTSARSIKPVVIQPGPVLVVSGSLNPVSVAQSNFWEKEGRKSVTPDISEKKVDDKTDLLIKTFDEKMTGSIKKLNKYAFSLWKTGAWKRVILNGGDTAYGFLNYLGYEHLKVIKSVMPGIALTGNDTAYYVLKPGGYGEPKTLVELVDMLSGK